MITATFKRLFAIFFAVVLTINAMPSQTTAASPEFRAFWADAFGEGLYDAPQIDELVSTVKAAKMNAIVAQVVRRGDCFCNRSIAPRTEAGIAASPFDPLDYLIAKAHAEGIEVHAWIIATSIWRGSTAPAAPNHAFNTNGPGSADNWLTVRSDGAEKQGDEFILDLGHPGAADYMARLIESIVANYAVDGVNLDRIRYPDGNLGTNTPSWGYNPTAVARFQAATGRSDTPEPRDPQWAQWRRDQVTALVRRVYLDSYALKPQVRVSVDTITYGAGPNSQGGWTNTRTYAEQLQDWRSWQSEGIIDLNIPMNYKRDAVTTEPGNQQRWYSEWSDFAKDNQFARQTAIGAALYLNEIQGSISQIREALRTSGSGNRGIGWVGYSYRTPDTETNSGARSGAASRAELTRALTQRSEYDSATTPVFSTAAAVPEMPWKTQASLGHIRGTLRGSAGEALSDRSISLINRGTGTALRTQTTDGNGRFGFVDVSPGGYSLSAGNQSASVQVSAGQVATASVTASCVGSVGPGIPAPAAVQTGLPGRHAAWYGQSGYPTLCPGERSTATVAFRNTGSIGWVAGRMGEAGYLGTWNPEPGQDQPSALGGDGTNGSPDTGWPRFNRVAMQPAPYVGPNQEAWFQFTVVAPTQPGTYRLAIRPLIEGAQWLEDYGVFWVVTVRN